MLQQQQLAQTVALQQQMPFGLMPGVPGDGSEKSCTVLPIHPHFPAVKNATELAGLLLNDESCTVQIYVGNINPLITAEKLNHFFSASCGIADPHENSTPCQEHRSPILPLADVFYSQCCFIAFAS